MSFNRDLKGRVNKCILPVCAKGSCNVGYTILVKRIVPNGKIQQSTKVVDAIARITTLM